MPYADPEKRRAHYKQNRERVLSEQSRRYASDPEWRERKKAAAAAYRARNLDEVRERERTYAEQNREKRRAYDRARAASGANVARILWRNHGLRPEDRVAMYQTQSGCCYLCGEVLTIAEAVIDHDHHHCPRNTSCPVCRRGLAHSNCNVGIGYADDSPARLRRMADALEVAQLAVAKRAARVPQQLGFESG